MTFDHFTLLLCLKTKYQCILTFDSFLTMVKLQFNTNVKSIQIDSGGEFIAFKPLLNKLGLIHKFSCPHTSKQNRLVESTINVQLSKIWLWYIRLQCLLHIGHIP